MKWSKVFRKIDWLLAVIAIATTLMIFWQPAIDWTVYLMNKVPVAFYVLIVGFFNVTLTAWIVKRLRK